MTGRGWAEDGRGCKSHRVPGKASLAVTPSWEHFPVLSCGSPCEINTGLLRPNALATPSVSEERCESECPLWGGRSKGHVNTPCALSHCWGWEGVSVLRGLVPGTLRSLIQTSCACPGPSREPLCHHPNHPPHLSLCSGQRWGPATTLPPPRTCVHNPAPRGTDKHSAGPAEP